MMYMIPLLHPIPSSTRSNVCLRLVNPVSTATGAVNKSCHFTSCARKCEHIFKFKSIKEVKSKLHKMKKQTYDARFVLRTAGNVI